jgi:hypothetical protein
MTAEEFIESVIAKRSPKHTTVQADAVLYSAVAEKPIVTVCGIVEDVNGYELKLKLRHAADNSKITALVHYSSEYADKAHALLRGQKLELLVAVDRLSPSGEDWYISGNWNDLRHVTPKQLEVKEDKNSLPNGCVVFAIVLLVLGVLLVFLIARSFESERWF